MNTIQFVRNNKVVDTLDVPDHIFKAFRVFDTGIPGNTGIIYTNIVHSDGTKTEMPWLEKKWVKTLIDWVDENGYPDPIPELWTNIQPRDYWLLGRTIKYLNIDINDNWNEDRNEKGLRVYKPHDPITNFFWYNLDGEMVGKKPEEIAEMLLDPEELDAFNKNEEHQKLIRYLDVYKKEWLKK